jgi:hypothetical protein
LRMFINVEVCVCVCPLSGTSRNPSLCVQTFDSH